MGVPAIGVDRLLGTRRPYASWVVRDGGEPSGYTPEQMHPNILMTPHIIRTREELERVCNLQEDTGSLQ